MSGCCFVEVGGHSDALYARPDCWSCAKTSTDGAATFSATRFLLAQARAENTEISSASAGI